MGVLAPCMRSSNPAINHEFALVRSKGTNHKHRPAIRRQSIDGSIARGSGFPVWIESWPTFSMFTSLAIAPIVNVFAGPKADGRWPSCGRRGQVGRMEGTPQNEEGTRSEPRRSEPTGGERWRDVL